MRSVLRPGQAAGVGQNIAACRRVIVDDASTHFDRDLLVGAIGVVVERVDDRAKVESDAIVAAIAPDVVEELGCRRGR